MINFDKRHPFKCRRKPTLRLPFLLVCFSGWVWRSCVCPFEEKSYEDTLLSLFSADVDENETLVTPFESN